MYFMCPPDCTVLVLSAARQVDEGYRGKDCYTRFSACKEWTNWGPGRVDRKLLDIGLMQRTF